MSFDESHEDFDDRPIRCVECGALDSPQDCEHTYRPGGPACERCAPAVSA
jgi:hypothetical protein